jgi:hypothetical protein
LRPSHAGLVSQITFLHGIVAFSGWPLNALRRDDHYKKPIGKNSAKKTTFSSGKRGLAAKDVFRFKENLGKHPYVYCGKIRSFAKIVGKTAPFRNGRLDESEKTVIESDSHRCCQNATSLGEKPKIACGIVLKRDSPILTHHAP